MLFAMPECVSLTDMATILTEIKLKHDWADMRGGGKSIKYVDMVYDQRSMSYFRITFRGFGDISKTFTTQNRLHDGAEDKCVSLYQEIMDWLEDPEGKFDDDDST